MWNNMITNCWEQKDSYDWKKTAVKYLWSDSAVKMVFEKFYSLKDIK